MSQRLARARGRGGGGCHTPLYCLAHHHAPLLCASCPACLPSGGGGACLPFCLPARATRRATCPNISPHTTFCTARRYLLRPCPSPPLPLPACLPAHLHCLFLAASLPTLGRAASHLPLSPLTTFACATLPYSVDNLTHLSACYLPFPYLLACHLPTHAACLPTRTAPSPASPPLRTRTYLLPPVPAARHHLHLPGHATYPAYLTRAASLLMPAPACRALQRYHTLLLQGHSYLVAG